MRLLICFLTTLCLSFLLSACGQSELEKVQKEEVLREQKAEQTEKAFFDTSDARKKLDNYYKQKNLDELKNKIKE